MKLLGPFPVTSEQHAQFKNGSLWQQWLEQYPFLFSEEDKVVVEKHAHRGYYFYEWLAALILYHTTGYLSLVDHYQYRTHIRKNDIFRQLAGQDLADMARHSRTYCPDLLIYKPDMSNWCFVEVKGPNDNLRENQITFFNKLRELSQKPIYVVQFVFFDN